LLEDLPLSGVPEQHQAKVAADREREKQEKKERAAERKRQEEARRLAVVEAADIKVERADEAGGEEAIGEEERRSSSPRTTSSARTGSQLEIPDADEARRQRNLWRYNPTSSSAGVEDLRDHLIRVVREHPDLQIQREKAWAYCAIAHEELYKEVRVQFLQFLLYKWPILKYRHQAIHSKKIVCKS